MNKKAHLWASVAIVVSVVLIYDVYTKNQHLDKKR